MTRALMSPFMWNRKSSQSNWPADDRISCMATVPPMFLAVPMTSALFVTMISRGRPKLPSGAG